MEDLEVEELVLLWQMWHAGGQVEVHSEKHCIRTTWAGQAMLKINAAHTYEARC